MKRKIVFACMISALLLSQTAMAAPNVEVNGTQIDTDAVIIDDKTYVPLRGVFEAAGAEVSWNEETQTAGINISNSLSDDELIPSGGLPWSVRRRHWSSTCDKRHRSP